MHRPLFLKFKNKLIKMKTNINPIIRNLVFTLLILTSINSQSSAQYLNSELSQAKYVPKIFHDPGTVGNVFFDLSPISSDRPDISLSTNALYSTYNQHFREGTWNQNNGSGNFSNANIFLNENLSSDEKKFKGSVFTKLRNQSKEDLVLLRENQIQVHWNENNSITTVKQVIPEGAGNFVTKGSFNWQDNTDDIAITNGSQIKVFKNLSNGFLESTPIAVFNIVATKFRLAQITTQDGFNSSSNPLDRADLVSFSGSIVSIYKNTDQNQLQFFDSFNAGFDLTDIELADLNDDGFNELIIVGKNGVNNYIQVYSNNNGNLFLNSPAYSNVSSVNIPSNALISVSDLNVDGYNDLLLSGYEGLTSIFINKGNGQYFNTIPEQKNYLEYPSSSVTQIKTIDLYNKGGIGLVMSYSNSTNYGVKVINATVENIPPPPPIVAGSKTRVGAYIRPKIIISDNRGVKDFKKYQIFKAKENAGWVYNLIGETTENTFIDNTEYLQYVGGTGDGLPPNCYYKVKSVDSSNQASILSKGLGYRVGIPSCLCEETATASQGDNLVSNSNENSENQELISKKLKITNFPNPFNPTTKIYFSLPKEGQVKISVFNTSGQLIKVLINEFKNVGDHTVDFDGSNLSSGIYFYRIETNNLIETKRMILTK